MKKILTAGTWDLFHVGHLNILKKSKELGNMLTVGVSTDELTKSHKGSYPVISFKERIAIIRGIEGVDIAYEQKKGVLSIKDISIIKPDIITIGSDWKNKKIEGLEWFKLHNGEVIYLPYTSGISTTILKKRILAL